MARACEAHLGQIYNVFLNNDATNGVAKVECAVLPWHFSQVDIREIPANIALASWVSVGIHAGILDSGDPRVITVVATVLKALCLSGTILSPPELQGPCAK